MPDFLNTFEKYQSRVNHSLDMYLPDNGSRLHQAMRYSLLNGGKRIRPVLCYATADLFGGYNPITDRAACAVEMIHAYSLIHDDLPAMDNDDLRRGKPTCHLAYDEATAILAGDALQARAFEILCPEDASPQPQYLSLIRKLAKAAGSEGMVAGQALDLAATNNHLTLEELEMMHLKKTGALIAASVMMGALSTTSVSQEELRQLELYSKAIGLAFQVKDDILDVESPTETLGKRQGSDQALNKSTYTSLLGIAGAKEKLAELHQKSLDALRPFGDRARVLSELAHFIVGRTS